MKKGLANIAFACVCLCLSTRAYRFTAVRLKKFCYNSNPLPFSVFDGHRADDASLYSFFFLSSPTPVVFWKRERESAPCLSE